MRLLRKKTIHVHQVRRKLQEQDIEIERAHRIGKTMIDGVPNKKRTIIDKFLNFKDKQEVLSECKAGKL